MRRWISGCLSMWGSGWCGCLSTLLRIRPGPFFFREVARVEGFLIELDGWNEACCDLLSQCTRRARRSTDGSGCCGRPCLRGPTVPLNGLSDGAALTVSQATPWVVVSQLENWEALGWRDVAVKVAWHKMEIVLRTMLSAELQDLVVQWG